MKILQVNASYKPAFIYGGPTMSVSMLSEQLVKAGIFVNVVTTTANGPNELAVEINKPIIIDGVSTIYFKRITKDHTHFSPALLKHVWKTVKNYDVVHIHAWWNLVSVLSCLIAVRRKVPVVLSPRGTLSSYSFNNKNNRIKDLIHNYLGLPLLKKSFVHTTSENESTAIKKLAQPRALFNIPNFIKLPKVTPNAAIPSTDHLKLLFFSRIEEKKGLDILLNALKTVTIPYHLTIAGSGDETYIDQLKNLAIANNIVHKITWAGFFNDDKFHLLQQHHLMILPSHDENFGNVVIESLCVGTAVLISDKVGLADYVEATNFGWICQTNASSVSDTINAIDTAKLEKVRADAPDRILTDFDESQLVKRYIIMYQQVINT